MATVTAPKNQRQAHETQQQTQLGNDNFHFELQEYMLEPWGHDITDSDDSLLRIIGGNVQGFQLTESGGKLQDLSQAMIDTRAEIACWCETNIDTNKYQVRERIDKTIHRFFPHVTVTSTSAFILEKTWKPGGTSITTRGRALGRVNTRISDELGRWSTQVYQGKLKDLAVVSAYQPCIPRNESGYFTVHNQQKQQLRHMGRSDTDPRRNFIQDLNEHLHNLLRTSSIILVGDFNDDLSTASGIINLAKAVDESEK